MLTDVLVDVGTIALVVAALIITCAALSDARPPHGRQH